MRYVALFGGLIFISSACSASPILNHHNGAASTSASASPSSESTAPAPSVAEAQPPASVDEAKKPPSKKKPTEECKLQFNNARLCASITWTSGPVQDGENAFTLKFWKMAEDGEAGRKYVDPEDVLHVFIRMPSMTHDCPKVTIKKRETGVFDVSHVELFMPGDWRIFIQLLDGKTVDDEVTVDLKI